MIYIVSLYDCIVHVLILCLFLQDGWTALHFAASSKDVGTTKLLINNGAEINVADKVL